MTESETGVRLGSVLGGERTSCRQRKERKRLECKVIGGGDVRETIRWIIVQSAVIFKNWTMEGWGME